MKSALPYRQKLELQARATQLTQRLAALQRDSDRVRLARCFVQLQRLADAAQQYDILLKDYPHHPALWLEAGQLADQRGELSLAIDRLQHAASLQGRWQQRSLHALCQTLMHAGQYTQAGRLWYQHWHQHRQDLTAWAGATVCALAAGRTRLAQRLGTRTQNLHTHQSQQHALATAWTHTQPGNHAQHPQRPSDPWAQWLTWSARVLEHSAQHYTHRADMHYHHAMCRKAMQQPHTAYQATQRALQINPRYARALNLRNQLQAPDNLKHAA